MRIPARTWVCAGLVLTAGACSGPTTTTTHGNDGKKLIVQKAIPQGPFYPGAIEATVADLITAMGPVDASTVPVAVVMKDPASISYWSIANAGATQALAEIGAPSRILGVPAADVSGALTDLGTDYKALVFSPYDGGDTTLADEVKATGAHTVLVDTDTTDTSIRDFFFSIDNYRAGYQEGTQLAAVANGANVDKSQPVLVFGANFENWAAGKQRTLGCIAALSDAGYTNAPLINTTFTATTDAQNLQNALRQNPSTTAMIGAFGNGYQLVDALKAVKGSASYAPIPTYVFDTEVQTLNYMASNDIAGTMVQRPYFMAYLGVYVAFAENFLSKDQIRVILDAHLGAVSGDTDAYEMGVQPLEESGSQDLVSFYNALGVSLQ